MRLRILACAVLSAIAFHASATEVGINAAGQVLLDRASSLFAQGHVQQAFDAYREAAKADPASSLPDSMTASMLMIMADGAEGEQRALLQRKGLAFARSALEHHSADPVANELLRIHEDENAAPPLRIPTMDAGRLMQAGEAMFGQQRYAEALVQYEAAAQSDPLYSTAWVFAGDCFFAEKRWSDAETRYRKAATIEPLNGQAWRFLSDSLAKQGRQREAQDALLSGIAAQPSQRPNWDKLDTMLRKDGIAMARLHLPHRPKVVLDPKTGKANISLDQALLDKGSSKDMAFWIIYASSIANTMSEKDRVVSPFATELAALRDALVVSSEAKGEAPRTFDDPSLELLRKLGAKGQLETAILLLMYRESYRPEFEAWKKANPHGVREFVLIQNVRP